MIPLRIYSSLISMYYFLGLRFLLIYATAHIFQFQIIYDQFISNSYLYRASLLTCSYQLAVSYSNCPHRNCNKLDHHRMLTREQAQQTAFVVSVDARLSPFACKLAIDRSQHARIHKHVEWHTIRYIAVVQRQISFARLYGSFSG